MSLNGKQISFFMKDYSSIKSLYRRAFPKNERIPLFILRLLSHKKNVCSMAFYDDNTLCGFSYLFINDKSVYILFLAVNDSLRSRGYGTQILAYINQNFPGRTIFLDAETIDHNAANNLQRVKRMEFYEKNGIHQTNCFFEYSGTKYEILSSNKNFSKDEYMENLKDFFKLLRNKTIKEAIR